MFPVLILRNSSITAEMSSSARFGSQEKYAPPESSPRGMGESDTQEDIEYTPPKASRISSVS
jgi:hypothetical protein